MRTPVTPRVLLLAVGGILGLVLCAGFARAGQRASRSCRRSIGVNVHDFVHTSLKIMDACHQRTGRQTQDCNMLSSPQFAVARVRADSIMGAQCMDAADVLTNYARVEKATDLGGVLLPALQRLLESNGAALQGPPSTAGDGVSAKSKSRCSRAIGKATTAIVTQVLGRAVACQRGKDKKATSFGAIDEQCFQVDAPKQEAKVRSSITRKCAGLSGPQVGSCSPLPDCVITQSLVTARAAAEDTYGAPPDARGGQCGNGILDVGEFCDDGNRNDQDACTNECVPARCGDGIVEVGVEECDDANNVETDACTHLCQLARCGDGIVEAGVEECDDGAAMPNADCADCRRPPVTCTAAGLLATGSLVAKSGAPDLGGVTVELSYPAPLGIPGSGADPSVRTRVTDVSGAGGFPTVNDTDSNGDGVDDDLKYGYALAGGAIPIGPLVQVQFDCPAGTMVLPASLPCSVTDASDTNGLSLSTCTVDGSPCRVDADCQPPKATADEGTCDTSPRPRCTITLAPPPG